MFNVFKLPDVVFEIVAEYLNEQEIKSLATTCHKSLRKPSLKVACRREVFSKKALRVGAVAIGVLASFTAMYFL
jgi:hypothetical protein